MWVFMASLATKNLAYVKVLLVTSASRTNFISATKLILTMADIQVGIALLLWQQKKQWELLQVSIVSQQHITKIMHLSIFLWKMKLNDKLKSYEVFLIQEDFFFQFWNSAIRYLILLLIYFRDIHRFLNHAFKNKVIGENRYWFPRQFVTFKKINKCTPNEGVIDQYIPMLI